MAAQGGEIEGEDDVVCIEITQQFTFKAAVKPKFNFKGKGYGKPELGPKRIADTAITCADYEPATQRMYAGTENAELCYWTMKPSFSGVGDRQLVGSHKGPISCMHILKLADGKIGAGLVLTGSADSSLRVWAPAEARPGKSTCLLQTLVGHGGTVTSICRTNGYIFSGSRDGSCRIWRAAPGREQALYPWFEPVTTVVNMQGWIHSLSFSRTTDPTDHGLLYVSDEHGNIVRVDIDAVYHPDFYSVEKYTFLVNGKFQEGNSPPLAFRRTHERAISQILFLAMMSRVVCLSYDRTLTIFNIYTGLVDICITNTNSCPFTAMVYDSRHNQIILVDAGGHLSIFSFEKGDIICIKQVAEEPILGIVAYPNTTLYTIVLKDRMEVWNINHDIEYAVVPGGHTDTVISLYAVKGGTNGRQEDFRVFSAGLDNTLRLWDPYDMSCIRVLDEEESEIASLTIFEALGLIATGHDDGHVRVWNLERSSTLNMKRHTNTVSCLGVCQIDIGGSHLAERLISCSFDGTVAIWEVRKEGDIRPHMIARWEAHKGCEVLALLYDPMKKVILTAGTDNIVRVWSNSTFQLLGEHIGHREAVISMALDANFLFSGSDDCDIRMWDTVPGPRDSGKVFRSGTHLRTLKGHTAAVTGLDVMPLSGHLASCSIDCTIRVWDYKSATVVRMYNHYEEMRCLALRADTDEIIVGTEQANILRFPAGEEVGTITARQAMEAAMEQLQLGGKAEPASSHQPLGGSRLAAKAGAHSQGASAL